jgi:hypothetical protein
MEQEDRTPSEGSYTVNLLGSISSHLAGLQGYDVMALELIQNADDAEAKQIVFDITDQGLVVENSAQFTYCGDLQAKQCPFLQDEVKKSCDFHNIIEIASAGKLYRRENIGRFGIGLPNN